MQSLASQVVPAGEVKGHQDLLREAGRWDLSRYLRFYNYIRLGGWIHRPGHRLAAVLLIHDRHVHVIGSVGLPSPDIALAADCRFEIETLAPRGFDIEKTALAFKFQDGSLFVIPWPEICAHRAAVKKSAARGPTFDRAHNLFFDHLRDSDARSVLEIGSRARSGVVRRDFFEGLDYVGMDIVEGRNVDVVGDAHELSRVVSDRRFDAVYTVSTFEHLVMPWKVALEINRVLNPGGLCYVATHQALGMHDLPWDYWRFSDTAWHGLFNRHTGFEILATHLGEPMHLVPFEYCEHWKGAEASAGFAVSSVVCRKTAETSLSWEVPARQICVGDYPG